MTFGGLRSDRDIIQIDIPQSYGIGTAAQVLAMLREHGWSESSVLPHGGKVHYERISRGDDYTTAVFRNGTATGEWFGSTITWNGNGWNLTRRDGLTYIFGVGRSSSIQPLPSATSPAGTGATHRAPRPGLAPNTISAQRTRWCQQTNRDWCYVAGS